MRNGARYMTGGALAFAVIGLGGLTQAGFTSGDEPLQAQDDSESRTPPVATEDGTDVNDDSDDYFPASGEASTADGAKVTFDSGTNTFVLYDTKCDAHLVYADYKIKDGGDQRHDYQGGCGNSTSWTIPDEGGQVRYRACVNVQRGFDKCSGWKTDSL
jgi:hypothetical protein